MIERTAPTFCSEFIPTNIQPMKKTIITEHIRYTSKLRLRSLRFIVSILLRMSSVLMRNPSLPCACQSVTTSSGWLSLAMAFSLEHRVEAAGENLLDAMDLRGHVARRDAGDLGDPRGVGAFEIEEDDLPLERIQLLDEFAEASERLLTVECALGITITGR